MRGAGSGRRGSRAIDLLGWSECASKACPWSGLCGWLGFVHGVDEDGFRLEALLDTLKLVIHG